VLWACSRQDFANSKWSTRADSIAERRSESLFSIDCRRLNTSDNCKASCPSGRHLTSLILSQCNSTANVHFDMNSSFIQNKTVNNKFCQYTNKELNLTVNKIPPEKNSLTEQSPVGQCRYTNSWLQARLSWLKHVWSARRSVTESAICYWCLLLGWCWHNNLKPVKCITQQDN